MRQQGGQAEALGRIVSGVSGRRHCMAAMHDRCMARGSHREAAAVDRAQRGAQLVHRDCPAVVGIDAAEELLQPCVSMQHSFHCVVLLSMEIEKDLHRAACSFA